MHTIATDLSGMAAYIGAVASLFATAGLTKAWSEKYEHPGPGMNGPIQHGPHHGPMHHMQGETEEFETTEDENV